jgi:hypothetical protein
MILKKGLKYIWGFIKKFPITCYGMASFLSYLIFSYDYYIWALIFGAPFMFVVLKVEKLLFPNYFLNSASGELSIESLVIELCVIIFVTLLLDFLLFKLRTKLIRKGVIST